jgi:hypothetical protein
MARARAEAGRALRKAVPRSSHASWDPAGRPSPLRLLEESNRHRVPELVPIRAARMRASPFAFLRGAPAVMAHDWDVKRLATSFVVAGRTVGFDPAVSRRAALAVVRTYREQLAAYAGMRLLEVWYSRVDAAAIVALSRGRRRRAVARGVDRAQHHTNLDALPRLTEPAGGSRRFVEEPPLLTHVAECDERWTAEVLASYRASLWCCCSGTATTTRCCSRSSRPPRRCWSRTPAAAATATRAAGWSTASGCSRRPATSSSAGPATAPATTTSASCGT